MFFDLNDLKNGSTKNIFKLAQTNTYIYSIYIYKVWILSKDQPKTKYPQQPGCICAHLSYIKMKMKVKNMIAKGNCALYAFFSPSLGHTHYSIHIMFF